MAEKQRLPVFEGEFEKITVVRVKSSSQIGEADCENRQSMLRRSLHAVFVCSLPKAVNHGVCKCRSAIETFRRFKRHRGCI